MNLSSPILFLLLLMIPVKTIAQEETGHITSKIENTFVEGILKLTATATNQTQEYQELNYLFVSIKKGGSGNLSNNKQSGKFTLQPDETKQLSEININIKKKDAVKVFLYIKDEQTQKLLSKDSLEINAQKFENKISKVNENDLFEIKGLTIDETKTKVGKDFYDIFYLMYSNANEKSSSAVTINELPTIGRSSQISVVVEDKTLYSFVSNPAEDFLKEQANLTMKIIKDYFQKKTLIKNEFIY